MKIFALLCLFAIVDSSKFASELLRRDLSRSFERGVQIASHISIPVYLQFDNITADKIVEIGINRIGSVVAVGGKVSVLLDNLASRFSIGNRTCAYFDCSQLHRDENGLQIPPTATSAVLRREKDETETGRGDHIGYNF